MERNLQSQNEREILNSKQKENLSLSAGRSIQAWIQDFIKQLAERLEKMEEVLVVDRIEENIAVCENRENGKMREVNLTNLQESVKEGDILKYKNGKYELDIKEQEEIEKRIEEKMKDVWDN